MHIFRLALDASAVWLVCGLLILASVDGICSPMRFEPDARWYHKALVVLAWPLVLISGR